MTPQSRSRNLTRAEQAIRQTEPSTTTGAWTIARVDIAKLGQLGKDTLLEWMQDQCTYTDRTCKNGICVTVGTFNMNCIDRQVFGDACIGTH